VADNRGGPAHDPPETVADVGEFGLIDRVTAGRRQPPTTLLGPGDDAALVAAADGRVVASTDVLTEGVHFRLDWSTPEHVGRKAIAVNMADIAAMGAVPTALLVGLACPRTTTTEVAEGLAAGMWREAVLAGAGLVGGDVVTAKEIVISVTALGDLEGREPVTRGGALPGDVVAVAGRLGWAAAGLAALGRGLRTPRAFVDAHRRPQPPYRAGPEAARLGVTAMIDVSDGLIQDLGHVAAASRVRVELDAAAFEVPEQMAELGTALGADPLDWVLAGGEDHALVATFPAEVALPGLWRVVGRVLPGVGVTVDGRPWTSAAGWEHFR